MSTEPGTLSDPLQAAEKALKSVCRGDQRKYYRFSEPEGIGTLSRRLREIHPGYDTFEEEELLLYGKVEEQLRRAGLFRK